MRSHPHWHNIHAADSASGKNGHKSRCPAVDEMSIKWDFNVPVYYAKENQPGIRPVCYENEEEDRYGSYLCVHLLLTGQEALWKMFIIWVYESCSFFFFFSLQWTWLLHTYDAKHNRTVARVKVQAFRTCRKWAQTYEYWQNPARHNPVCDKRYKPAQTGISGGLTAFTSTQKKCGRQL